MAATGDEVTVSSWVGASVALLPPPMLRPNAEACGTEFAIVGCGCIITGVLGFCTIVGATCSTSSPMSSIVGFAGGVGPLLGRASPAARFWRVRAAIAENDILAVSVMCINLLIGPACI